jgi:predicted acyl esterase
MKRQALMMLLIVLAALAWAAPLTARRQSPVTDQQSFLPPTAAFIGRTEQIPMRDGQSLAADIYLPKVGGKHPVVLIQTPYNKTPIRSWWQGEVYPVTIELNNTALTFLKGHRMRLIISSSNYPKYSLNLNDGGPMYRKG